MIKLIASDLDGTLLQNNAPLPSPHALDLITQLLDRGVYFTTASGREHSNLTRLFAPIRDRIFYIAENGALTIVKDQVIARGEIPKDLALRILRELKKDPAVEILVSCERCCYIDSHTPSFIDHIINEMQNKTEIIDDLLHVPDTITKMAVYRPEHDPKLLKDYQDHLQSLFGRELKIVTSGSFWLDFIAPNANKGTALLALMQHLSIQPEECMAFGDQYNDIEMLRTAGVSYAMSNSAPGISYYSKYVTNSVEEVLEDLLLTMEYANARE